MKKNIVLIGFSGCGKTTIGTKIATLANIKFFDSDKEIEKSAGMSISDIFANSGESVFREMETRTIKELSKQNNCVLATGGGCIKNHVNIEYLKETGILFYLKSSAEKIYNNIKLDNSRPLLHTDEKYSKISKLLAERTPLYEKYADVIIDITDYSVDQATECLLERYYNIIQNII